MKFVLLTSLFTSLVTLNAFADQTALTCQDGNVKFVLTYTPKGVIFSINPALVQNLNTQGKQVPFMGGAGQITSTEPCISYTAGVSHSYSLSLSCDQSGGQLFSYTDYSSFTYGRPHATYYFNAGKCR